MRPGDGREFQRAAQKPGSLSHHDNALPARKSARMTAAGDAKTGRYGWVSGNKTSVNPNCRKSLIRIG